VDNDNFITHSVLRDGRPVAAAGEKFLPMRDYCWPLLDHVGLFHARIGAHVHHCVCCTLKNATKHHNHCLYPPLKMSAGRRATSIHLSAPYFDTPPYTSPPTPTPAQRRPRRRHMPTSARRRCRRRRRRRCRRRRRRGRASAPPQDAEHGPRPAHHAPEPPGPGPGPGPR
jgi:hypothetical protein